MREIRVSCPGSPTLYKQFPEAKGSGPNPSAVIPLSCLAKGAIGQGVVSKVEVGNPTVIVHIEVEPRLLAQMSFFLEDGWEAIPS